MTIDRLPAESRYNLPMAHSYEEVHELAHELPADQRLMLANSLWESIDPADEEPEGVVAAAWDEEIKRRLDEIDSGAVKMISHEEFLADLDAHIAGKRQA